MDSAPRAEFDLQDENPAPVDTLASRVAESVRRALALVGPGDGFTPAKESVEG